MTDAEKRAIRKAFGLLEKSLERSVRHIEQSIGRLDVSEREHHVEIRDELRKVNRRLSAIEKTVDETNRHAKFTSATIAQLQRSLETAGVIGKLDEGKAGTYSQVINPKSRNRS